MIHFFLLFSALYSSKRSSYMALESTHSDKEIVLALKKGGVERERMIQYLLNQHAGYVFTFTKKFHLPLEAVKDLYADSIVALSRQIEKGDFRSESKISTYLYGILNNKCKKKLSSQKESIVDYLDEMPHLPAKARSMLGDLIKKDELNWVDEMMKALGEVCRKILWDSDYYGYNLSEIAERINYKSGPSVSSKKYKCLEQLRKLIKSFRATGKI